MRSAPGCAPRRPRSTAPGSGQILTEEGFGRLVRGPEPHAGASPGTAGRDTHLPRASVIDFAAFPARADTSLAGLLLVVPDLVALDLPAWWPGPATPAPRGDPRGQRRSCPCWR